MSDDLIIEGPAGPLQARYDPPLGKAAIQAVVCHPHPEYGGSMQDAVLARLAATLSDAGIGVLRFNFRGVGASAGRYGGGAGEVDDLLAAADWLLKAHPGARLWAGGYSFGAWITWQALDHALRPERVMLIAPPVGAMPFPSHTGDVPTDVVIGSDDDFADPSELKDWAGVKVHFIRGADHFFTGRLDELARTLRELVGD